MSTPPPGPPSFEKLVLGFGSAIALLAYLYWTYVGISAGEGWTGAPAARAFVVLGASALLALVFRLAVYVNTERP